MNLTADQKHTLKELFSQYPESALSMTGPALRVSTSENTSAVIWPSGKVSRYTTVNNLDYLHSTEFPDANGFYYLYGSRLEKADWELFRHLAKYTVHANRTNKLHWADIRALSKLPIWSSPNLERIVAALVEGQKTMSNPHSIVDICSRFSEDDILKWVEYTKLPFSSYFSPHKCWGICVTEPQYNIIKKVNSYLNLPCYTKYVDSSGLIIIDNNHYFFPDGHYERRSGGTLWTDLQPHPSYVSMTEEKWHIDGHEVPKEHAAIWVEFDSLADRLCNCEYSPDEYQIMEEDIPDLKGLLRRDLYRANYISNLYFGDPSRAMDLIRLLGTEKIGELFRLSKSEIISALDDLISSKSDDWIAPIAAVVATTLLLNMKQKRVKHAIH